MANHDSASYLLRFNEVTQTLEYQKNGSWVTVPIAAASIDSGAATIGDVLTANGTGGAAFA